MKQTANKLLSRAGETIAETLIALLISTLALMVLAGMISSTGNLVKSGKDKMDAYYRANGVMESFGDPTATKLTIADGTYTVSVDVQYATNETFTQTSDAVTAYRLAP